MLDAYDTSGKKPSYHFFKQFFFTSSTFSRWSYTDFLQWSCKNRLHQRILLRILQSEKIIASFLQESCEQNLIYLTDIFFEKIEKNQMPLSRIVQESSISCTSLMILAIFCKINALSCKILQKNFQVPCKFRLTDEPGLKRKAFGSFFFQNCNLKVTWSSTHFELLRNSMKKLAISADEMKIIFVPQRYFSNLLLMKLMLDIN